MYKSTARFMRSRWAGKGGGTEHIAARRDEHLAAKLKQAESEQAKPKQTRAEELRALISAQRKDAAADPTARSPRRPPARR
jgi:hypothetical protein